MIIGIGVDMVEIKRIESALAKFGMEFCHKMLSSEELQHYKNYDASLIASLFTAKEAFVKAIGSGFREGINLRNISVIDSRIYYPEEAKIFFQKKNVREVDLSKMINETYAMSMVICRD